MYIICTYTVYILYLPGAYRISMFIVMPTGEWCDDTGCLITRLQRLTTLTNRPLGVACAGFYGLLTTPNADAARQQCYF